jgi:TonB family protein
MSIKSLISSILKGKKLMFLSVGFMVVFLCGVGLNPVKAQEKRDTIKQRDDIPRFVEIAPNFPGGIQKWYEFLKENVQYPSNAEGTVVVCFVVEKDGSLTDFTILRSSGNSILDEEALRVVKLMPNWIPGKIREKPVSSYFQIPINFQSNDKDENKNNNTEKEPLKGKKTKK